MKLGDKTKVQVDKSINRRDTGVFRTEMMNEIAKDHHIAYRANIWEISRLFPMILRRKHSTKLI